MTDLGLLAEQVGVSERTLRRAANQGTLRATRLTPRTLKISPSEKRFVRRSWPLLASLRSALRSEPNVRFALLFGSVATGADTADSDVDLLVEMRDRSLERIVDLEAKLSVAAGRPVDLTRLEDAESDPRLLADAVAEGRVLVDRAGLWPELHSRESALRRSGRRSEERRARQALAGIDRLLAS